MTAERPACEAWTTIPIESMQVGRRYVTCQPGREADWTVESVQTRLTTVYVWRDGEYRRVPYVMVTYANGISVTADPGESVAVMCDVPGVVT